MQDLVENIEPGVAQVCVLIPEQLVVLTPIFRQRMGENALALVKYLSSVRSPLPTLTDGYTPPSTVFFSYIGIFIIYSFSTAKLMYTALLLASIVLIRLQGPKNALGLWRAQARGVLSVLSALAGGVIVPNVVAFIMSRVLGKGMSWFSHEYSAMALYGVPMLLGKLCPLFFSHIH